MKKGTPNYLIIFCVLLYTSVFTQTPPAPSNKKWERVEILSDEFEQESLDEKKWDDYHPQWVGRQPSAFKKGNAYVEDGYLKLKSTLKKHPSTVNNPLKDVWVNSAACVSKGWDAKPGYYYEANFKASSLSMTSSFWFRVGKFSEIDVIEHIGNPSIEKRQKDLPFKYGANTHYYGKHKGLDNKKASWTMPTRGRDDFHTYGLWWKNKNELIFYYDGKEVMKIKPRVPFDEKLKMIFDTEVFPFAQAGIPSIGLPKVKNLNDPTKNTMLVDWVRVYELKDVSTFTDEVSFNTKPVSLTQNKKYTFNVNYKASTDREIVVGFYKDNKFVASKVEKVTKGSGLKTVNVELPELPVVGNGYNYKLHIRPLNTTWREAIDNDEVNNVTIVTPFKQLVSNGTYFITSGLNKQRLLARALESHSARMHNPASFDDQKWIFKHLGNNTYTINNKGTKRFLEVSNKKCVNGANVTTWKSASDSHQKWKIVENGNGVYGLKPLHCKNLGLDVSDGAIDANVQIWNYKTGNDHQKWKITEIVTVNKKSSVTNNFKSLVKNEERVSFFPNPSKDVLFVSKLKIGDQISIYNLQGQELKRIKTTDVKEGIAIDNLSKGMYLIQINNNSIYKFIKN